MTATRFATPINIFTGQKVIELVPIPEMPAKSSKGKTMHDAKFDELVNFDKALKIPEYEFNSIRKALQRYLDNKGLRATVSVRQRKDHRTKSYAIWLANEPPKVLIPRGKKS
jgi:hypothetical protein